MRILSEPVGAGSMQNRFRVEVRRCNLSHELFSSQPPAQSPENPGSHNTHLQRKPYAI
jgi:hypothetical protein